MSEGSLEVKPSDNMDRWKAEVVRVKEEKRREEKGREGKGREEKKKKKEDHKEKVSEERRSRCPKRQESRETLCFSNDVWLRKVEK